MTALDTQSAPAMQPQESPRGTSSRSCAWCGGEIELNRNGTRAGRRGEREFCCQPHQRRYTQEAQRIGRETLGWAGARVAAERRARELPGNSGELSRSDMRCGVRR